LGLESLDPRYQMPDHRGRKPGDEGASSAMNTSRIPPFRAIATSTA
jgi:hypothetical protein